MDRLQEIGRIIPRSGKEIKDSRLGLGLEKLDRDLYDPTNAYDYLAASGAKWIRLQSGWQRTEKQEGVYDFAWLDEIVDALIARGMTPWIDLCYGNSLYTESAREYFGAVGVPPLATERERTAWDSYVRAIARHFAGRVNVFEIWNEPDGNWCWKHGANGTEYGEFAARTAKALHEVDENIYAIGGVLADLPLPFLRKALDAGMGNEIDALSYHRYNPEESEIERDFYALRMMLDEYNPEIEIIQGESGGQSSAQGMGAMHGYAWTEEKQAKYLLRHRITDLHLPMPFTCHFTALDMAEALKGKIGDLASYKDYGYFGVLSAQFGEDGRCTGEYKPKKAYYALQNLAAMLSSADVEPATLSISRRVLPSRRVNGTDCTEPISIYCFERDGKRAICYWRPAKLLTETYEGTVSFLNGCRFSAPLRLVNPMDGKVYALPDSIDQLAENDMLENLPLLDSPLILMEEGFAAFA